MVSSNAMVKVTTVTSDYVQSALSFKKVASRHINARTITKFTPSIQMSHV